MLFRGKFASAQICFFSVRKITLILYSGFCANRTYALISSVITQNDLIIGRKPSTHCADSDGMQHLIF